MYHKWHCHEIDNCLISDIFLQLLIYIKDCNMCNCNTVYYMAIDILYGEWYHLDLVVELYHGLIILTLIYIYRVSTQMCGPLNTPTGGL